MVTLMIALLVLGLSFSSVILCCSSIGQKLVPVRQKRTMSFICRVSVLPLAPKNSLKLLRIMLACEAPADGDGLIEELVDDTADGLGETDELTEALAEPDGERLSELLADGETEAEVLKEAEGD